MFVIDADNAFGLPRGDVDDAYAIAAMIRGGAEIAALAGRRKLALPQRKAAALPPHSKPTREFGKGSRKVRVCTSFDAKKLWKRFVSLASDQPATRL